MGILKKIMLLGVFCTRLCFSACTVEPAIIAQTLPMKTIAENAPLGTILAQLVFPFEHNKVNYARCDVTGGQIHRFITADISIDYHRYRASSRGELLARDSDGRVIPGISVKVTDWLGHPVNEEGVIDYYVGEQQVSFPVASHHIKITFIKTGTIASGRIKIGNVALVVQGDDGGSGRRYIAHGNHEFVIQPACTLHYPFEVKLHGAAYQLAPLGPKSFFAVDVHCSSDVQAILKLHSPHGHAHAPGVLQNVLSNATSAQGVGVLVQNEVLQRAVNFGDAHRFLSRGERHVFPYSARLYKTHDPMVPGEVTSYLHLELQYQ